MTATEVVNDFWQAYRDHDVEKMVDLTTERATFRYVPFEVWLRQRVVRADENVRTVGKTIWTTLIDCFPDLTNDVTWMTADDEGHVAVEVNIGGTQAKHFGGIRNVGRRYDLPHVFLFHLDESGKIDRIVSYWDTADWYQQLGKIEVD
ncbi:MAG: nuclear transport factor 2 family protein [bacterium]